MLPKKKRTEEKYLYAAACMRLADEFSSKALHAASKLLYATDSDKLWKARETISKYKSKLEDNMFDDGIGRDNTRDYLDVFYGTLRSKPRSEIEAKVQQIAADIVKEIMGGPCDE